MSTEPSQKGFPGSRDGDSEQTWHKLVEAHMGCKGSSILSSHEGRDRRDHPVRVPEFLSQVSGSGHVPADTTVTPPGLRPPLKHHCPRLLPHRLIPLSPGQ